MAVAPAPASKSLLLDYVSPVLPVVLFRAIRNSHYEVVLAISSSSLLAGLTIFSTGLFTTKIVDITSYNVSLITNNKFDFSNVDWTNVDSRSTAPFYAMIQLGLDYPLGTNADYAVQDFSLLQGEWTCEHI